MPAHETPLLRAFASLPTDAETLAAHDALVLVAPSPLVEHTRGVGGSIAAAIERAARADASLTQRRARPAVVIAEASAPGGRLVLAPMAPLTQDLEEVDDVRLVAEATFAAVTRAVDAGAHRPLLVIHAPEEPRFARATEVAALAALATRWAPLEAREAEKAPTRIGGVGLVGLGAEAATRLEALELGRTLCRDITGADPERMAPLRAAELCEQAFSDTNVRVTVERDVSSYPLLAAVARASMQVERHRPAVVTLDYRPEGPIERTILLAGKGVTYDTGGADLKTDGSMAGASRDKGGAGAVAGLVRALAALGVPGVRVVGLLGFVRNSIGEDAYVSDETIRSRAGVRVRIGNTDAEGRLVLADLLAKAREIAVNEPRPILLSIATLTGHVYRAHGPYTGILGNAAARSLGIVDDLDRLGEMWGEPFERSRPRREDYAMVAARTPAEDVVSSNRLASVSTPRGHQFPFAFLDIASGLKGDRLPFAHLDIAGTAMENADWQFGRPTGVPILTLAAYLERPA